jgi:hypothetical protein
MQRYIAYNNLITSRISGFRLKTVKKGIVLLVALMLLASFAFVGGVSADEDAPHLCVYVGWFVGPGVAATIDYYDVNGELLYRIEIDNLNGSDFIVNDDYIAYLPIISGTVYVTATLGSFGSFTFTIPANELGNGECFDDFRLNSRPDRDLAAPVAIYFETEAEGAGFDVYDINQFSGTGTLSLRVTAEDLSAAYDEARETGANVTIAQDDDILFTMLGSSTADEGVCQVNAVDSEGKPYEFSWVCWR